MPRVKQNRTVEELQAQQRSYPRNGKDKRYREKHTLVPIQKQFIAHDGEGVDDKYVLLMNSVNMSLIDTEGLSTSSCLSFLCLTAKKYPDAIHICYGASYDVNMMLRDLPYQHALRLQKTNRCYWKNYSLEYVPRKFFRVQQYTPRVYGDKRKRKPEVSVTLWDVIGFFQGKFTKSLREFFTPAECTSLHIEEIEEGKAVRNDFTEGMISSFIIPYTTYEVEALVALMNKLRDYCLKAGIHLKRYDGSGAIAAYLLTKHAVKEYYGVVEKKPDYPVYSQIEEQYKEGVIPWQVEQGAGIGFGGGRVELFLYGHTDATVFNYDIRSGYPDEMVDLLACSTGYWKYRSKDFHLDSPFSLYKIYWKYPRGKTIYPFFFRTTKGQVRYTHTGYTHVWSPELRAALDHLQADETIVIFEQWEFIPITTHYPYAFVKDLYDLRALWKRNGEGAQLPLKLGVNSFYGKTIQTVGYNLEEQRLPPFFHLLYAGMITSGTRAKMYKAAMQSPESIIAIATDGIWSLVPLDLPVSENLGEWDYQELTSFTSVQAGVYFAVTSEGKRIEKYRGFNQDSISEEMILSAWSHKQYAIPVMTRRFITLGTGIASRDRFQSVWRTWQDSERSLQIVPNSTMKRTTSEIVLTATASTSLIPTIPVHPIQLHSLTSLETLDEIHHLSQPHTLPWQKELSPYDILLAESEAMLDEIEESNF